MKTKYLLSVGAGILAVLSYASSAAYAANPVWIAQYDVGTNSDIPVAVRTDNFGNTYVAGYSRPPGGAPYVAHLVKYNSIGGQEWDTFYAGNSGFAIAQALIVDSAGYPIVVLQNGSQITTIKYN